MISWKTEIADTTGQWSGNALRFGTEREAREYAAVRYPTHKARVVGTDDLITSSYYKRRLQPDSPRLEVWQTIVDEQGAPVLLTQEVMRDLAFVLAKEKRKHSKGYFIASTAIMIVMLIIIWSI